MRKQVLNRSAFIPSKSVEMPKATSFPGQSSTSVSPLVTPVTAAPVNNPGLVEEMSDEDHEIAAVPELTLSLSSCSTIAQRLSNELMELRYDVTLALFIRGSIIRVGGLEIDALGIAKLAGLQRRCNKLLAVAVAKFFRKVRELDDFCDTACKMLRIPRLLPAPVIAELD